MNTKSSEITLKTHRTRLNFCVAIADFERASSFSGGNFVEPEQKQFFFLSSNRRWKHGEANSLHVPEQVE